MDQAKQSFKYSSKNIPIHSQREHRLHLLRSVEKFRHNLSWRVFHFLNPSNGCQKKTFGLLSSKPAPVVHELKPFFSKLENLMRGLEYKKFSNPIQKKLKEDCQKIAQNADVEQRNIVESLDLTCRDLCRADGRHIQSTMARTQVWLQPPGEMREHWAGTWRTPTSPTPSLGIFLAGLQPTILSRRHADCAPSKNFLHFTTPERQASTKERNYFHPVSTETNISFSLEEKRKSEISRRTGTPHSVSLLL